MNFFSRIERRKLLQPGSLSCVSKGPQTGLEMLWQVHALGQDSDLSLLLWFNLDHVFDQLLCLQAKCNAVGLICHCDALEEGCG